jgi:nuclear pore complex protein Nup98-Nup96
MIRWLNQQVTDAQIGGAGASSMAGGSYSRYQFRPAAPVASAALHSSGGLLPPAGTLGLASSAGGGLYGRASNSPSPTATGVAGKFGGLGLGTGAASSITKPMPGGSTGGARGSMLGYSPLPARGSGGAGSGGGAARGSGGGSGGGGMAMAALLPEHRMGDHVYGA